MARVLITYVDGPSVSKKPTPEGLNPERWMPIERALRGSFTRVAILAARDFHWERLIADDYGAAGFAVEPPTPTETPVIDAGPLADSAAPPADASAESQAPDASTHTEDESHQDDSGADTDTPLAIPSHEELDEEAAAEGLDHHDESSAPAVATEPGAEAVPTSSTDDKPRRAPRERRAPTHVPPANRAELLMRLEKMRAGGNPDVGALICVAEGIAQKFGLPPVACRLAPGHVREKDQSALIRMIVLSARPGESLTIDLADAPRPLAAFAIVAAHAVAQTRPDVTLDEVYFDRSTGAPQSAKPLLDLMRQHARLGEAARGRATFGLLTTVAREPQAKPLLAFAHRIQVATAFASPMDLSKAARAIREKFTGEPSSIAEAALRAFAHSDVGDAPWSARQLGMALSCAERGRPFHAAAHCREALISGLLEAYGQNPCRGWVTPTGDVPPDARVRPREVAAAVLGSDEIRRLVPDLDPAWRTAGNPRARFLHIAPTQGDPGLMKSALNDLGGLLKFTAAALEDGRLKAIALGIPWDDFLIRGLEAGARLAPPKEPRRGDRGPRHPGEMPRPFEGDRGPRPPQDGPPRGDRGPRPSREGPPPGDRGPRPDRAGGPPHDRGPRPPRDDGPRAPREVRVHGGPPMMGDGPSRPRQVPVGGTTEVNIVRGGLGNLGQALLAAGLAPDKKPRNPRPSEEHAVPPVAPPQMSTEQTPPPTPPASFDVAGPTPASET